jgi:type I restriction enzyme S subunit
MMEDYQNTEIGFLPNDWDFGRIDDYFTVQQGKQVSKSNRIGENQTSFLRTSNIFWGKIVFDELDHMHFSEQEEVKFQLEKNDLLVCEGGDIGRTAIWNNEVENCYYQNHLHRLRAKTDKIDPLFILQWLQYSFVYGKIYFGRGNITTIPNLSKSRLSELIVPQPELSEQRKIAHVLNTVQKAIEQQDKLIRTTTELKKALMHKLFTEGTRGEPQKETEIGLVPESWEVVELGKHSYIRTSFPTFNKLTAKYKSVEQGTEFFFLKVSDMNIAGNEIFIYESNNKFLNDKPTDFTNGFIKPNSLIFPKRGAAISTNKKRITTKYSVLDPNLIGVEPNSDVDGKFLYNYFEMFDLSSLQDNNVIPQLNKHNVAGVKLPLPSIEEQQIISKYIEIFDDKIKLIAKKKQNLTDLFKTLLHELMTGQRRVHELEFEIMEEFQ